MARRHVSPILAVVLTAGLLAANAWPWEVGPGQTAYGWPATAATETTWGGGARFTRRPDGTPAPAEPVVLVETRYIQGGREENVQFGSVLLVVSVVACEALFFLVDRPRRPRPAARLHGGFMVRR